MSTKSVDMPQVRNKTFILTTKDPQRFSNLTLLTNLSAALFVHCEIINRGLSLEDVSTVRGALGAEHVVKGRFPAQDAPAQPGGKKTFSRMGLVLLLVFS